MKCPFCNEDSDKVIDSRAVGDGEAVRRRRECTSCKRRFTTYEERKRTPLRVVKKNGQRESFDRSKIFKGMERACEKRPVPIETLEEEALKIEVAIHSQFDREAPSSAIGEMVMERLRALDDVAYVRFASVYRAFKTVDEFLEEVKPMLKQGIDINEARKSSEGKT